MGARSILITGANRGIGFHLLKKITPSWKPDRIFATFRDPLKSQELHEYASKNPNVQLIQLDVRDYDKFEDVAKLVESGTDGKGLNLLINNAGVTSKVAKITGIRRKELMDVIEVNTVAPILFTKAMLPQLEKGSGSVPPETPMGITRAAVVNVSSILGSIEENLQGGMYPYRCSKAALNAATRSMSFDFKKSKIIAISLHPGWVQTEMGGPKAPLTPDEATTEIIKFLPSLTDKHSGKFFQYDGKELPW